MLFPTLGPSSLPVAKDMQTEQLLCWSGMTDTEHSTTSSSNEEEEDPQTSTRNKFHNAIVLAKYLKTFGFYSALWHWNYVFLPFYVILQSCFHNAK